jgi:hypothetical protein
LRLDSREPPSLTALRDTSTSVIKMGPSKAPGDNVDAGHVETGAVAPAVPSSERKAFESRDQAGEPRRSIRGRPARRAREGEVSAVGGRREDERPLGPACDDGVTRAGVDRDPLDSLVVGIPVAGGPLVASVAIEPGDEGNRRIAYDAFPSQLSPLRPYAELLDVGGDLTTWVSASRMLTPSSAQRLVERVFPLLPKIHTWLAAAPLSRPPLSSAWAATHTLGSIVKHLAAPFDVRGGILLPSRKQLKRRLCDHATKAIPPNCSWNTALIADSKAFAEVSHCAEPVGLARKARHFLQISVSRHSPRQGRRQWGERRTETCGGGTRR